MEKSQNVGTKSAFTANSNHCLLPMHRLSTDPISLNWKSAQSYPQVDNCASDLIDLGLLGAWDIIIDRLGSTNIDTSRGIDTDTT